MMMLAAPRYELTTHVKGSDWKMLHDYYSDAIKKVTTIISTQAIARHRNLLAWCCIKCLQILGRFLLCFDYQYNQSATFNIQGGGGHCRDK